MNIQRLNVRIDQVLENNHQSQDEDHHYHEIIIIIIINTLIDQVEEDLLTEKLKIKKVSDDLNQTFEDMINMSVQTTVPWIIVKLWKLIILKKNVQGMIYTSLYE